MQNIKNDLKNYLENANQYVQEVLVVSDTEHPIWSDSLAILQLATQQILQPVGVIPDEHVIASIGIHAETIVTKKRDTVGFLITNFRVLTQTDISVLFSADEAHITLFTKTQDPQNLSHKIWDQFSNNNKMSLEPQMLVGMKEAINRVIEIVLPQLQKQGHLPQEIKKSTNIEGRIRDLGLQKVLLSYAEDEKTLKKFAEKFNVSDIRYGAVDKPFFGKPYGLVITPNGITSRDVMEESMTSTWNEIRQYPATITEKEDQFSAGHKLHIIPQFQKKHTPAIITLINELASGEVKIEKRI